MSAVTAQAGAHGTPAKDSLRTQWMWLRARSSMGKSEFRVEIYERFVTFTEEKAPMDAILRQLLANNRETGNYMQVLWEAVARSVINESATFSAAFGRYVPAAERVMIGVGETTGRMSEGFREALFVCQAAGRVNAELKNALIYPVLLLGGVITLLLIVALGIAPELQNMLDRPLEEWPFFTWLMYQLGDGVIVFGPWIAAVSVAAGAWIGYTLSRWTGRGRPFLDKYLPPWTIYREYQASGFLIALAALVRATRPIESAIRDIYAISSPWMKAHLAEIDRRLMDSVPPGVALDTGLLSREVAGYILDFEKMQAFRKGLNAVGVRGVERSIKRVAKQASVLRWVLTVVVVALMGLVYVGMMQPGYVIYTESRSGGAIR